MRRWFLLFLICGLLPAAAQLRERDQKPDELPPSMEDEDEDLLTNPQYAFNPIQARKDLKIGDFYAKKGNHRAAAGRYLEATKWNPNYAEAFWKLARAREKLNQPEDALKAYRKYLELEPKGKKSRQAQQKVQTLAGQVETTAVPQDKQ